jgi:hypothetical protein
MVNPYNEFTPSFPVGKTLAQSPFSFQRNRNPNTYLVRTCTFPSFKPCRLPRSPLTLNASGQRLHYMVLGSIENSANTSMSETPEAYLAAPPTLTERLANDFELPSDHRQCTKQFLAQWEEQWRQTSESSEAEQLCGTPIEESVYVESPLT